MSCYHHCSFWALPGRYSVRATNPQQDIDDVLTLEVRRSGAYEVSSSHPGARAAGLIAGIFGPIAIGAGVYVALQAWPAQCENCGRKNDQTSGPVGLALVLLGVAATPVGWLAYAANGPRVFPVNDEPTQPARLRAPHLQLGVLPLPRGGWGVGISTLL